MKNMPRNNLSSSQKSSADKKVKVVFQINTVIQVIQPHLTNGKGQRMKILF